ncbi:MAG: class C sortase [Eubacteriales bacterium]|nr:class C sortase [Eubacteriales bacterium]
MKNKLFIALILFNFLVGFGFILYPSIGNLLTLSTASVSISEYEEKVVELVPKSDVRLDLARAFNEHLYRGTAREDEDKVLNTDNGMICYLDIPKIDVYLPVYYGTGDEALSKGVGYIEHTSLPVGGPNTNTGLSGHTGLPGAELFSSLDKLEKKDCFYIHVMGEILAYEVFEIAVVEPDDSELAEIEPGRDLATLVTCTPYGINSHRLLVRGERIPYTPEVESADAVSEQSVKKGLSSTVKRQILVIAAIAGFALFLLLIGVLYSRRQLGKHQKETLNARAEKEKDKN